MSNRQTKGVLLMSAALAMCATSNFVFIIIAIILMGAGYCFITKTK